MKKAVIAAKLKIFALLFIFAAAVALATSGTLAFFTDSRETTGVFTAGNVYIELTEAAVVADAQGNLIEDTTEYRVTGVEVNSATPVIHNYGYVYPGQTIHKDPTVKNIGDDAAWVAVKVIIEDGIGDVHSLYSYNDVSDDIDIELLLRGGLLGESIHVGEWNGIYDVCHNDNYAMVQNSSRSAGIYEFIFYMLKPLNSGESVEIFDTLFIDNEFGNEEMQHFRELKVTVQAFAVQKYGFSDCYKAMNGAFEDYFKAN